MIGFNIFGQDSLAIDPKGYDQIVVDTTLQRDILIGNCHREMLLNFPEFAPHWNKEYNDYKPYTSFLNQYRDSLVEYQITIVFGSWCGDSQRELPHFFKIMDALGIQDSSIHLIAVDKNKKAGSMKLDKYYVELVPTFIFYKNNIEVGRIIEMPTETLETDIANIISTN